MSHKNFRRLIFALLIAFSGFAQAGGTAIARGMERDGAYQPISIASLSSDGVAIS